MKKLIFVLLILTGCTDQELRVNPTRSELNPIKDTSPMTCPNPQFPGPKLFDMDGSYPGPVLNYLEPVTMTWQTHDLFNPNNPIGDYVLTISVKNLSSHSVSFSKNGGSFITLTAGSSNATVWSGSCDECYGPTCPAYLTGSFYFTIKSHRVAYPSCDTYMEVSLLTDSYNIPHTTPQIYTYHFVNQDPC